MVHRKSVKARARCCGSIQVTFGRVKTNCQELEAYISQVKSTPTLSKSCPARLRSEHWLGQDWLFGVTSFGEKATGTPWNGWFESMSITADLFFFSGVWNEFTNPPGKGVGPHRRNILSTELWTCRELSKYQRFTSDTKINLITKHGSKSKMLHTWEKEKQRLWVMGDLPVQDLVEWPHAGPCTWLKEIDAGVSQMKSKKSWFVWQRSLINQCESVNLCPISILNLQLSLRTTNRKYIQGPEVNLFA